MERRSHTRRKAIRVHSLTRAPLAKALRLTLGLVIGLTLLPVAVSAWQLWSAANKVDYIGQVGVPGAHIIGRADGLMNTYRKEQWQYLTVKPGDDADRKDTTDSMAEEVTSMSQLFASYRKLPLTAADEAAVAKFEGDWNAYLKATQPEMSLADAGKYDDASATFNDGAGDNGWQALKKDLASWRTLDVAVANKYRANARWWAVVSLIVVAILLVAAVVVAVCVGRLLARRLTLGLARLSAAADGIANGDVDQRVETDADDEIAVVARAFEGMVDYLRGMAAVSQRIASGDLAVTATPKSPADRLGEAFADMVVNLNRSISDVTGSAGAVDAASQQLGHASDGVRQASGEVLANVERQRDLVSEALQAASRNDGLIDAGLSTVDRLAEVIDGLDRKSAEIGGITGTITRIAQQTNLLALNASIEAARAGAHGAGFAVVAEEVRVLAEESGRAANSIAELVTEIQVASGDAVRAVDDHARPAFRRIADGIGTVRATLDEVSTVAVANVESTERMAEATAIATEQVLTLGQTAQRLREVAGRFSTVG